MTVVGLLNLSSAIRFHSEGGSKWLAFSGVFMVVVGSANLILQWRRLPTTGEG
jgi:uncharacterized membrane protein HdeD (DUF308 family)